MLCSKTLGHFRQSLKWSYQKNICNFPNIIFQYILNLAKKVAKYKFCHLLHKNESPYSWGAVVPGGGVVIIWTLSDQILTFLVPTVVQKYKCYVVLGLNIDSFTPGRRTGSSFFRILYQQS